MPLPRLASTRALAPLPPRGNGPRRATLAKKSTTATTARPSASCLASLLRCPTAPARIGRALALRLDSLAASRSVPTLGTPTAAHEEAALKLAAWTWRTSLLASTRSVATRLHATCTFPSRSAGSRTAGRATAEGLPGTSRARRATSAAPRPSSSWRKRSLTWTHARPGFHARSWMRPLRRVWRRRAARCCCSRPRRRQPHSRARKAAALLRRPLAVAGGALRRRDLRSPWRHCPEAPSRPRTDPGSRGFLTEAKLQRLRSCSAGRLACRRFCTGAPPSGCARPSVPRSPRGIEHRTWRSDWPAERIRVFLKHLSAPARKRFRTTFMKSPMMTMMMMMMLMMMMI